MLLSDAVEVMEAFGTEKVNAALREGWKLLAATSAHRSTDQLDVLYTLGRTAERAKGHHDENGQFVPEENA
jgi:hypothetical protein